MPTDKQGEGEGKPQTEVKEDEFDPDAKFETKVQRGEVWQLGEHRLMCGDSTSAEDVAKLMNGEQADLWLTDPPYNVAIGITDIEDAKRRNRRTDGLVIENDAMSNDDFHKFLVSAFKNAADVMKPGAAFYIWFASREHCNFELSLNEADLRVRQELIWNKNSLIMGRQDYQWKHEPCLYGWKEGAAHNWYSDRCQSTVIDWNKPSKSEDHPTMKPVGLFGYQIQNSSKEGDIILDSFGGSGTTIVACEQIGRKARLMEFEPHYCNVIIARWEKLTGQKAIKLNQ
jgi:site-specific DNA-methyltransferase (adenine-specific)